MVERVVNQILEHDGVWFAQMHEIAELFLERAAAKNRQLPS
jgi:hypothetical protein